MDSVDRFFRFLYHMHWCVRESKGKSSAEKGVDMWRVIFQSTGRSSTRTTAVSISTIRSLPALAHLSASPRRMASPSPEIVTLEGKEYRPVREGLASVLAPYQQEKSSAARKGHNNDEGTQAVFYNPIQQFNRDLSVLAMLIYGEGAIVEKANKFARRGKDAKNRKKNKQRGAILGLFNMLSTLVMARKAHWHRINAKLTRLMKGLKEIQGRGSEPRTLMQMKRRSRSCSSMANLMGRARVRKHR